MAYTFVMLTALGESAVRDVLSPALAAIGQAVPLGRDAAQAPGSRRANRRNRAQNTTPDSDPLWYRTREGGDP